MRAGLLPTFVAILAIIVSGSLAVAQNPPPSAPPPPERTAAPALSPSPGQTAAPFTPEQLDQLTAPIALYPDPLLSQILMAATYPLEVVEADRWLQQPANAALSGDQLADALAQQRWDPSVKAMIAFPRILQMMDGNLSWMEQLGDAFLADQTAVMGSVQRLRQRAEAAGKLQSTPQQAVSNEGGAIIIEPPAQNIVYVPVYDPNAAYGTWPSPDYPPDYFPGVFPEADIGPLGFGWVDMGIVAPLFGWAIWDWHHHHIRVDTNRFSALSGSQSSNASDVWQHDPSHRGSVPYRDPVSRARFQSAATAAAIQGAHGVPIVSPLAMTTPIVNAPSAAEAAPAIVHLAPPVVQSPGGERLVPTQVEPGRGGGTHGSTAIPEVVYPRPTVMPAPRPVAVAPRVVMVAPRGAAPMVAAPRSGFVSQGRAGHR